MKKELCSRCNGLGFLRDHSCPNCAGQGEIVQTDDDRIDAEIEAVIEELRDRFPTINDYSFDESGEIVEIFDRDNNVIGTITPDQLISILNEVEDEE